MNRTILLLTSCCLVSHVQAAASYGATASSGHAKKIHKTPHNRSVSPSPYSIPSIYEVSTDARHYTFVEDYARVLALNEFKNAYVRVNENPAKLEHELLENMFRSRIQAGDYAPMVSFFYNQIRLFDSNKQQIAAEWLKGNDNDPISIYLYLRWWSMNGNVKELQDSELEDFWYKRYMAELLTEIDLKILNIKQTDLDLSCHVRNIADRFKDRLDEWMMPIAQTRMKKERIFNNVADRIEATFNKSKIILHGDPRWLLTTEVDKGYTYGLLGSSFAYKPIEDEHSRVKRCPQESFLSKEEGHIKIKELVAECIKQLRKLAAN